MKKGRLLADRHPAADLLKVLMELTRVDIELCSLWQNDLEVALQFRKLNQARLQHEHDIVEVGLETTRNLAQGDRIRVENKYLYLTEATHEPFAFIRIWGQREELPYRHLFEIQVHV